MADSRPWSMNYHRDMNAAAQTMIASARRSQEWLRDRPRVLDVAFAALAAMLALGELTGDSAAGGRQPDMLGVVLVLLGAFALIWRRRAPIAVAYFVAVVSGVFYTLDYGSFMAFVGLSALYSVAAHEQNRRMAWIAIGSVSGGLVVLAGFTVLDRPSGFSIPDATGMTISIAAVIAAGAVIRNKEAIFADTQARAERAEADRKAEAERAVTRERLRIAREMHDVVAHGMSLIAVQASAAQEVIHSRPDDAARLMQSVEATSRGALTEMRHMLGVLRSGDSSDLEAGRGALLPQPTLADLDATITHCTEVGIPTELIITGDQRPLPAGIELAAFRIVQEALTNVVKHAGDASTAVVQLQYAAAALHLTITDTGCGAASALRGLGSGQGLIGMRERVEMYDGQLTAGPRSGGGYHVAVVLPVDLGSTRPAVASAEPERAATA